MATNNTVERILDGALSALGRHGHRKFSMSDVCDEASVSRGTLYRYFKNKDQVLEAIARHVQNGLQGELADAIAARPDPEHRLRIVLDVVIRYRSLHPESMQVMEVEPEFGLTFIREVFPQFIEILTDSLEPAAEYIPAVRDSVLTVTELAQLALRIAASTFFVPTPYADQIPDWVEKLACFSPTPSTMAKRRSARRASGRKSS